MIIYSLKFGQKKISLQCVSVCLLIITIYKTYKTNALETLDYDFPNTEEYLTKFKLLENPYQNNGDFISLMDVKHNNNELQVMLNNLFSSIKKSPSLIDRIPSIMENKLVYLKKNK